MAIVKCGECGGDVSSKAGTCPHCGSPVPDKGWLWKMFARVVVAVAGVGFIFYFVGEAQKLGEQRQLPVSLDARPVPAGLEVEDDASPHRAKAGSGPFGLAMGLSFAELGIRSGSPAGIYEIRPPAPHPMFPKVFVSVTDRHGLCMVKAVTDKIIDAGSGSNVKREYRHIVERLSEKYGQPSDVLEEVYPEYKGKPEFWMMALRLQKAFLMSVWTGEALAVHDIDTLGVTAKAPSIASGLVEVVYEFNNYDACLEYQRELDDTAL